MCSCDKDYNIRDDDTLSLYTKCATYYAIFYNYQTSLFIMQ